MKNLLCLVACIILLCSCGHRQSDGEKFQNEKLVWLHMETNAELLVITKDGSISNNVGSLDDAITVLGQYGWELVSVGNDDGDKVYYIKRSSPLDNPTDGTFIMIPDIDWNSH